ncbi:MAG TPA: YdeI/OmpD-associated family protein [Candidatus Saccharibacteria bacterium]|nr:YdeI/OmpD-associated family protein [Candidatus Saccharibacteria bacterium]
MKQLSGGTVHPKVPNDFAQAICAAPAVHALWEDITPLARNEWICWIEEAKQAETRTRRITVGISKMSGGMRRPCCWQGCSHRPDRKPFVRRAKATPRQ